MGKRGKKRPKEGSSEENNAPAKKTRANFPEDVTKILKDWFVDHISHPYPTQEEMRQLLRATNLRLQQINQWLQNHRARSRRQRAQKVLEEVQQYTNTSSSSSSSPSTSSPSTSSPSTSSTSTNTSGRSSTTSFPSTSSRSPATPSPSTSASTSSDSRPASRSRPASIPDLDQYTITDAAWALVELKAHCKALSNHYC